MRITTLFWSVHSANRIWWLLLGTFGSLSDLTLGPDNNIISVSAFDPKLIALTAIALWFDNSLNFCQSRLWLRDLSRDLDEDCPDISRYYRDNRKDSTMVLTIPIIGCANRWGYAVHGKSPTCKRLFTHVCRTSNLLLTIPKRSWPSPYCPFRYL